MNQTLSGSSSFTGRLPAQGTEAPERAASWPMDVYSAIASFVYQPDLISL